MNGDFDKTKSLEELDQHAWGEPAYDSYLVTTVHRLRRKPLSEFSVEDLRIMIDQQIGLPFLIPLAVECLEVEPLAGGDLYAGDLLQAVLRADEAIWGDHPDLVQRVRKIVGRVSELLPSLGENSRKTLSDMLAEAPEVLPK